MWYTSHFLPVHPSTRFKISRKKQKQKQKKQPTTTTKKKKTQNKKDSLPMEAGIISPPDSTTVLKEPYLEQLTGNYIFINWFIVQSSYLPFQ